jgi:transposase
MISAFRSARYTSRPRMPLRQNTLRTALPLLLPVYRYDKACGSDALRQGLAQRGIDLSCPHRTNRKRPPRQDGRKLRRYKRRWKVERTFACFGNFRRLVVRWERHITIYRAFFHVGCLLITLRQL